MTTHLNHLTLDGLRIGALSAETATAAHAHLMQCGSCRARQHRLDADAKAFAARFEPAALAAETLAGRDDGRTRRFGARAWLTAIVGASAAVASVITVGSWLLVVDLGPPGDDDIRLKGSATPLAVFEALPDGEMRAVSSGAAIESYRLRVKYDPGARRHTEITWADDDGSAASLLYRIDDGAARPGSRWMPREIVLDPGSRGRVVAAFCDAPEVPRSECDVNEVRIEVK
jgi:hypothetical protein